ncbi:MAG: glutamate--cysteine ligase [Steroidobacteraceae bacterium]
MSIARVDRRFEARLASLVNSGQRAPLSGGRKGVEKESMRVTPDGAIAHSPHPAALGSALTSSGITTDYSEALIELISPAFAATAELLEHLYDIHRFVYLNLGEELLWAASMPGPIAGEQDIPIARYGSSNVGRMKHVYRVGLGLRYGRLMQAIAGVHFNYSFPAEAWGPLGEALRTRLVGQHLVDDAYFALLRNYRRHGWLVLYLFGASPAVCADFLLGRPAPDWLKPLGRNTLYARDATSLRMSELGYRNKSQAGVSVSVNSLDEYVRDLSGLISMPSPEFARLGVTVDGAWQQLSANLLQIENEYYSFIRPKRTTRPGERPTRALARAGVEYVEMRSLDVGVFDPAGIDEHKMRFLEAFAALCLLKDSPLIARSDEQALDANHVRVARQGREPGLQLDWEGSAVGLREWAGQLLEEMRGLCELLDQGEPDAPYTRALTLQEAKLADPAAMPSAQVLAALEEHGGDFTAFGLAQSAAHRDHFRHLGPPPVERLEAFAAEAAESHLEQARIEAADTEPFSQFVANWFAD